MIIDCIIIEDEPLALKRTRDFVEKLGYLNLIITFDNSLEALNFLKMNPVDLIFLDIRMDELSGIEMLRSLSKLPSVIITSAYKEYALVGYELDIVDYLLKPFSFDRFLQAVDRVYNKLDLTKDQGLDYLFVKTDYRIEKITLRDIKFIVGMRDYRCIQTNRKILTLQTFYSLEEELPSDNFCRVHKSYIVNIQKIESVERNRIKIGDVYIPIGASFKKAFYKLIGFSSDGKKTR